MAMILDAKRVRFAEPLPGRVGDDIFIVDATGDLSDIVDRNASQTYAIYVAIFMVALMAATSPPRPADGSNVGGTPPATTAAAIASMAR